MIRRTRGPEPDPRGAEPRGRSDDEGEADRVPTIPCAGLIDLHSHLLPGVDDGAPDDEASVKGLNRFRAEGVTGLVVTPHFEAGLQLRPAELAARWDEIDRAWDRFRVLLDGTGLAAFRGVELRLDLAQPDLADPRIRLDGGRFLLCEFPWFTVPPRSERVLTTIREDGCVPVLAHPERYAGLEDDPHVVDRWLDCGTYLQVNGGSLLGRFGRTARRVATQLLEQGRVHYVASDYHARAAPRIRDYRHELIRLLGPTAAERLTETNPARLLRGEEPLPAGPDASGDGASLARGEETDGDPSAAERA